MTTASVLDIIAVIIAVIMALHYKTTDAPVDFASLVKLGELVDVIETTPLTLTDRRVFNELLAAAWPRIKEPVVLRYHQRNCADRIPAMTASRAASRGS